MMNTTSIRLPAALFRHFPVMIRLTACFLLAFHGISQQIELDGFYTGKNIYIQSPETDDGYCVTSIVVNGISLNGLQKESAIEIPLDRQFLTDGDSVHIVIYHQKGCKPKVLTAGCVFSRQESVENLSAGNGSLSWTFNNPPAGYKWIVQQYRWNQWDTIGTVIADIRKTDYSFPIRDMHSGDNRFRLVGVPLNQYTGLSEEVHVPGPAHPVEMTFRKKEHYVVFSTPTHFRVINEKGTVVREDSTQSFLITDLPKGIYFVLFDNHSERIRL